MYLNNKKIIITGATSGIGYQLVKLLHTNNDVIAIARNSEKLHKLETAFKDVTTYQADLSDIDGLKPLMNKISQRFNSIDILVNNVAVQHQAKYLDDDFSYETIAEEINLNLTSICCLSYLSLPLLLQGDKPIIMNVNSGLAIAPKTSSAIYCATKAGLDTFSQSLRYQLAHTNIEVYQAFLDLVDTPMTAGRGHNKMSPEQAATKIIYGLTHHIIDHDIGKVKWLRRLLRLAPSFAKKMMSKH